MKLCVDVVCFFFVGFVCWYFLVFSFLCLWFTTVNNVWTQFDQQTEQFFHPNGAQWILIHETNSASTIQMVKWFSCLLFRLYSFSFFLLTFRSSCRSLLFMCLFYTYIFWVSSLCVSTVASQHNQNEMYAKKKNKNQPNALTKKKREKKFTTQQRWEMCML